MKHTIQAKNDSDHNCLEIEQDDDYNLLMISITCGNSHGLYSSIPLDLEEEQELLQVLLERSNERNKLKPSRIIEIDYDIDDNDNVD